MKITLALNNFYLQNKLSADGGENEKYFYLKFKLFSIKLPNSDFRKKVVYIHDIQHVLFDCDITWKGESFIAGWEISSCLWKHFPVGILSLWAMGFSLLNYPKEVLKGYKKGLNYNNLVNLNIPKEKILQLTVQEINESMLKQNPQQFNWVVYTFWCVLSQLFFWFPFLIIFILSFYVTLL